MTSAPLGPPWNPNHRGIPVAWTGIGSGGNAEVWFDGKSAVKRLRAGAGKEAKARFRREVQIVEQLRTEEGNEHWALVPVLETRDREGSLEIVMQRLDGTLEDVVNRFKGDPVAAACALVPIAETLAFLAAREPAIHHRDVKPSNILVVRGEDESVLLLLSDFGCAYVAGSDRLTDSHRAVGAWKFRAPEYSGGRVEEITEKGDVYSLGKVFWAMVNGERDDVFPESLWHLPKYDLNRRFGGSPAMLQASLLVAGAVQAEPAKRPTLPELVASLGALGRPQEAARDDQDDVLRLLKAESLAEVEHAQRRAAGAIFVRLLTADLHAALSALVKQVPNSQVFRQWKTEADRAPQTADALVMQVAEQNSDAHVVNSSFRRSSLNTRFHPATPEHPIRLAVRVYMDHQENGGASFWVHGHPTGLVAMSQLPGEEPQSQPYDSRQLAGFLLRAAGRVLGGS